MYWYILFVRTGREHKVEQMLKERLDTNVFIPFIPLQEKLFKISGTVKKELVPIFPSYVFVETEQCGQEFIRSTSNLIYALNDVICILKYSDTEIALRETERQILLRLCNDARCIESSSAIMVGDKIHVLDGPLRGLESIVKKINRHKRKAWIEIEFFGDIRLASITLEIVKKT